MTIGLIVLIPLLFGAGAAVLISRQVRKNALKKPGVANYGYGQPARRTVAVRSQPLQRPLDRRPDRSHRVSPPDEPGPWRYELWWDD